MVTRNAAFAAPGAEIVANLDEALRLAGDAEDVFVIGGGELYAAAVATVDRMIVTEIDADFEGDTLFAALDPRDWSAVGREHNAATANRPFAFDWVTYHRRPRQH